jgi:hypothetical protein
LREEELRDDSVPLDIVVELQRENAMKVRCVKLLDSRSQPVERSTWATVGAVYRVLGVWMEPGQTRLRLLGDERTPALFEPELFEVVSSAIPLTWVVTSPKPGCLSFEPEARSGGEFWERFFDGEPEAIAMFEEQRAKIVAADP